MKLIRFVSVDMIIAAAVILSKGDGIMTYVKPELTVVLKSDFIKASLFNGGICTKSYEHCSDSYTSGPCDLKYTFCRLFYPTNN